MKFKVSEDIDVNGSSFKGDVQTTYKHLVETFGEPSYIENDPDEKVSTEWQIEFDDGTVATIYDWKQYSGKPPLDRYSWHIGGFDTKAVHHVLRELDIALPHEFSVGSY
jgi:hypothetical protein